MAPSFYVVEDVAVVVARPTHGRHEDTVGQGSEREAARDDHPPPQGGEHLLVAPRAGDVTWAADLRGQGWEGRELKWPIEATASRHREGRSFYFVVLPLAGVVIRGADLGRRRRKKVRQWVRMHEPSSVLADAECLKPVLSGLVMSLGFCVSILSSPPGPARLPALGTTVFVIGGGPEEAKKKESAGSG